MLHLRKSFIASNNASAASGEGLPSSITFAHRPANDLGVALVFETGEHESETLKVATVELLYGAERVGGTEETYEESKVPGAIAT